MTTQAVEEKSLLLSLEKDDVWETKKDWLSETRIHGVSCKKC